MNRIDLRQIKQIWEKQKSQVLPGLRVISLTSLTIVSLVIGAKQLGWLQPLELKVFDRMVRLREDQLPDDRLLIVEITENDIQTMARSTPDDATLAKVLRNLEQHQPRVIGLDLHRDVPQEPGNADLQQQLKSSNLIAITKLGEQANAVPPPPNVPPERVGFNDLPVDEDGIVRRNLLFASTEDATFFSFALRLALFYLEPEGLTPEPGATDPSVMQIGSAEFQPLGRTSGAYEQLDDRGYQILLNYRGRWNVARTVSLMQVLKNEVPEAWIRNKIVLIGTTAPSAKDLFYTPYSAGEQEDHQMAGVVIHAQMVSQIISTVMDGEPLFQFWTDPQEWLWILAWSLLAGSLAWTVRHPIVLGLSASGLMVLLVGACVLQFQQDRWVPTVAPAIAALLSVGMVVANRAQQAHQQQKMVMTLLGQNTSPEIANALWQSRDRLLESGKLPGKRLVASMLFTDIRGFSRISEQMAPEALLEWLNEYLEAMTEEIQRHQGIINKFTGDGLLAVFGVPMPRLEEREVDEDAYRAVSCALAMAKRLRQLNQGWEERGFSEVEMRVGIFTGPVVVGSLGGRDRMEYGVIGDSVNIASRLESCAKERQVDPCRILIAEETLVHIREHFEVEAWGPMALHGKEQHINIYRVLGYALPAPRQPDTVPVPEER